MECEEEESQGGEPAVNSIILDYYKKFGRKRDLEQYFSLSTAQGDVRDPTGVFWKNMKSHSDSSDSDGKRSLSSQELCRISIQCSMPEPSSSQDENTKTKSDSISPPIVTEDLVVDASRQSDEDSGKSGDEHSQKSLDVMLDTSANKPLSPTSSVTSQRKLEWDSLADVGYGNESDRKTSASSLSTLERMALHQQYSNNDTKESLGPPTAQSTPFEETENKHKVRKSVGRKTTKFYKKDVDFVEVNVPQGSNNPSQAINLNLTKHISFSVEKGGVTVENIKKDVSVSPEKVSVETEVTPQIRFDKEIQTSLTKSKDKITSDISKTKPQNNQKIPILISLNTLRNRNRRRKIRIARRKVKSRKRDILKRSTSPVQERSGEQLSAAESFEYMPGHIYNQNHLKGNQSKSGTTVGNKSSLESSGAFTTDSSKGSKHSFTKDLEKSIDLLKSALQERYDDNVLKKKLVKEVVQRLLKTKYRDDDSTTDFLSGLSFSSKKIGLRDSNSTSTSDANSSATRPKKSILRMDKFNASAIASSSQSAPNLPTASNSDKPIRTNLVKHLTSSNTDTEMSSKEKVFDNSLSEATVKEMYKKYFYIFLQKRQEMKREEAHRKHLRDKEMFLKQKLRNSDSAFKVPDSPEVTVNKRLKDVMKDLIRNNYDDGSGDASKLEGGSDNTAFERYGAPRSHRSHSVFTLSSGNSEYQNKKLLKKKLQSDIKDLCKPGPSHYCWCPHHSANIKIGVTDSSVQVNIKDEFEAKEIETKEIKDNQQCRRDEAPQNTARIVSDNVTGDIKYVCLCTEKALKPQEVQDNFLIYKCSRLTNRGVQEGDSLSRASKICGQSIDDLHEKNEKTSSNLSIKQKVAKNISLDNIPLKRSSKSSQTNLHIKMVCGQISDKSTISSDSKKEPREIIKIPSTESKNDRQIIHEATRCIQTEISINPQIADPSLSDINIVSDADCVKLISEQYKEKKDPISKTDVRSRAWQSDAGAGTSSDTGRNHATSEDSVDDLLEDVPFIESVANNKDIFELPNVGKQDDVATENFIIPIQGTNMKLMVSIGSNEPRAIDDGKVIQGSTKGVGTEQRHFVEESTSLLEECSKGVQYRNDAEVFADKSSNDCRKDTESNSNSILANKNKPSKVRDCLINTCMTQDEPKFNTYPKNVAPVQKKPFLRSNTDTGVLGCSSIQTDYINKKDISTQHDFAFADTCVKAKTDERIQDDASEKPKGSQNICGNVITENVNAKQIGVQTDSLKDGSDSCNERRKIMDRNNTSPKAPCDCDHQLKKTENSKPKEPANYKFQQLSPGTVSDSHESGKSKSTTECIPSCKNKKNEEPSAKDPVLSMIKNITKRYSKDDLEQNKRKKCFREIVTVLNYLLDTEDSTDREQKPTTSCTESNSETIKPKQEKASESRQTKSSVDKSVQSSKKKLCGSTVSSEPPTSTDIPGTSSDSATCKVLSKIKKECEKYHQKRCKSHTGGKKCEISSTTSVSCDQCRRVHHCPCRYHKCKHHRSKSSADKAQKKSVAYNLIIQTSESMISEETCDNQCRPLQNIIVKVPSKKKVEKLPFKEVESKIEKRMYCSPRCDKSQRSRSLTNECDLSSTDECLKRAQGCTVREYLEINRPDFVEKCSQRQNNLKVISESRANERSAHRDLLSMHLDKQLPLTSLNAEELRHLAAHFGINPARKTCGPKFISEKEMKKHSEKIYKSLPEVIRKKEEIKKENIKKTNLMMANMFKKNLQKKTLRGAVNLSNYSTII